MKESKKQKGTKVKLTKGKRVSLRCPLIIDSTVLEHNYDAGCAQICLTIENMGGGGITEDGVESAIVVIRLFDAKGEQIPCTKNEYFAKLLRFGEEGLASGAQITFRLTPDCDGGLRVENAEVYISRVRYTDSSVTDYLRGDFFDLPNDPIPLHKKHKKNLDAIRERFGSSAQYEPEEMTEIVWRCTCGEFSEADHCATCGASKAELFEFFGTPLKQSPAAAVVPPVAAPSASSDVAAEANSSDADSEADNLPATDATTEYDALAAGALAAANDHTNANPTKAQDDEDHSHEFRPVPPPPQKTDKLKIGLIIAIIASALLLAVIIGLLAFTLVLRDRQNSPDQTDKTTEPPVITTTAPAVTEDPISDDEKLVRTYLEANEFDNALGYARLSGCSEELIREILTAAVQYYTEVEPNTEKALQYAQELSDTDSIESINLKSYNEAMQKGDYESALSYAKKLTQDKEAKLSAAAEGLLQSQLTAGDFDAAKQTASTYQTETTVDDITRTAIAHYTSTQKFDEALSLAQSLDDQSLVASVAKSAITYYVGIQNYDSAADYVRLTGDSNDIVSLLPHFTKPAIKKNLSIFFPYLSFEDQQAIHASVMSTGKYIGIVDVYGNAFWGTDESSLVSETGKTAVSIKCSKTTTVLLYSDGTVAAFGDNTFGQCDVQSWSNVVAIDASDYHTIGLTADGKVLAAGRNSEKQCDVGSYSGAVAIAAGGYHTVVLFSDGTVVSTGMSSSGQCNTSDWEDVVMISAGFLHSVGLKSDGTVVAAGSSSTGRCDVDEWADVIQISAGESCTVGLTSDGKLLLASGDTNSGDVADMSNVIWVDAGNGSVTALQKDGNLLTTGATPPDLTYVSGYEVLTLIYGIQ